MPTDLDSYKNGDPESKKERPGGEATSRLKQAWNRAEKSDHIDRNGPTPRNEHRAV